MGCTQATIVMNITDNGCVVVIGHEPIKVFVNVDFQRFRYANRFFLNLILKAEENVIV